MATTVAVSALVKTGEPAWAFNAVSSLSGRNRLHRPSRSSRRATAPSRSADPTGRRRRPRPVTRHSLPRARKRRRCSCTLSASHGGSAGLALRHRGGGRRGGRGRRRSAARRRGGRGARAGRDGCAPDRRTCRRCCGGCSRSMPLDEPPVPATGGDGHVDLVDRRWWSEVAPPWWSWSAGRRRRGGDLELHLVVGAAGRLAHGQRGDDRAGGTDAQPGGEDPGCGSGGALALLRRAGRVARRSSAARVSWRRQSSSCLVVVVLRDSLRRRRHHVVVDAARAAA